MIWIDKTQSFLPEEIWQREQCRVMSAALPGLTLLHGAAATILGIAMSGQAPTGAILTWIAAAYASAAFSMALWLSDRSAAQRGSNSLAVLRRFRIGSIVAGLVWSLGAFLLFPPDDAAHQGFLAFTLIGVAASAAMGRDVDRLSALAFAAPPLLTLSGFLLAEGATHSYVMSAMVAIYLGSLVLMAIRSERHQRLLAAYRSDAVARRLQLAASESRLHHLLSAGPAVIFSRAAKRDGALTYVSPNAATILGYPPAELLGKYEAWVRHVHPDDAAQVRAAAAPSIEGESTTLTYRFRHRNGEWRWLRDERVLAPGNPDSAREIVGAWTDITAQRAAEDALRAQSEFEHVVAQISTELVDLPPGALNCAIDAALRRVGTFFKADRCYIFQRDGDLIDNTNEWCADGIEPQIGRLQKQPLDALKWQLEQLGRGIMRVDDVEALPPEAAAEKAELRRQGIRSLLEVPMTRQGEFIGFFGLDCVTHQRRWAEHDGSLLKIVADVIAGALARERAAAALQQSSELLDSVVENIPAMVFLKRADDLRFERLNRVGERLLGYTREEYLGKSDYDFFPKDQADQFTAADRKVLDSETKYDIREEPVLTKSGQIRYLRTSKIALRDADGRPTHLLGISIDITEAREIDAALRESRARLMEAQRIGRIGDWSLDLPSGVAEWSDVLYEIFGQDRQSHRPTLQNYFEEIAHPDDRPLVAKRIEEVLGTGRRVSVDHRFRRPDGGEGWVHLEAIRELGADGQPARVLGTAQDITARKAAELALQQLNADLERRVAERTRELSESEARLKNAHRIAKLANWSYDLTTLQWDWSEEFYHLFGLDPASAPMTLDSWLSMVHPEDRAWVPEALRRIRETHKPGELEYRIVRPDGETRVIHAWGEEADGKRVGLIMDVTDQVRTERSLAEAQRIAKLGSWEWIPGTNKLRLSQEALRIFGFEDGVAERPSDDWLTRVHPKDLPRVRATLERNHSSGVPYEFTYRIIRPDGEVRTLHERVESRVDASGALIKDAGICHDITENRQIELAMQALSHHLIALEGPAYFAAAAASLRELLDFDEVFISRLEPDRPGLMTLLALATRNGPGATGVYALRGTPSAEVLAGNPLLLCSGAWSSYPGDPHLTDFRIEGYAAEPIRDHTGRIIGLVGALNRRPLQGAGALPTILPMFAVAIGAAMGREHIHRRDAWLRTILENTPSDITLKDLDLRIMASSGGVETEPQQRLVDKVGKRTRDLFPAEVAAIYEAADRKVLATGRAVQQEVIEPVAGKNRYIQNVKFPMRDEAGGIIGVCSISTDVTELKETAERLAQAQKMEALGALTGGMAHDFNNYLAVIIGNLDLLQAHLGTDPASHDLIQAALRGATPSQELTRSLLAFARHQPLAPKIVDISERVRETAKLLERTLGEDIAVGLSLGQGLWPVLVDDSQLASCIVNLAKNARDAMPSGGKLQITAENCHVDARDGANGAGPKAGDYVVIEVSDTGTGIRPDMLANVFEPFFTTKAPGHGTGLGLSMVYGFVTQSGGDIKIQSEPGKGTRVRLYLPRSQEAAATQAAPVAVDDQSGGSETILLVEDNKMVRDTVAAQLKSLGYQVVEAASGDLAVAALERSADSIRLILSDVVMPGKLDGYGLAQYAQERWPGIRVLLMSGYVGDRVSGQDLGAHAPRLLAKPYRKAELARALRELLDSPARAAVAATPQERAS